MHAGRFEDANNHGRAARAVKPRVTISMSVLWRGKSAAEVAEEKCGVGKTRSALVRVTRSLAALSSSCRGAAISLLAQGAAGVY